jgi:large subunit ribosomal protein L5
MSPEEKKTDDAPADKVKKEAPKVEKKAAPKVEKVEAPKVEKVEAPKVEKVEAPKVEKKVAPKVEKKAAPRVEKVEAPKVEKKVAPKVEKKAAPKEEKVEAPKVEKKAAPKVEKKAAPKEEKVEAPKEEVPSIRDGEEEEKPVEDLSVKAPAPKAVRQRKAVRRRVVATKASDKPVTINYDEDPSVHMMRRVHIEKVVVNIGVGEAGEKLEKAEKVLKLVTRKRPARTLSRTTNRDLGIRKAMPIGCKVTLRGKIADEFLRDAFWIKQGKIAGYSFDSEGNFSFGIPDYTDFPEQKYDPDIGIFGMDISVVLTRPGKRIHHRRRMTRSLPPRQRLNRGDAQEFIARRFSVEVVDI